MEKQFDHLLTQFNSLLVNDRSLVTTISYSDIPTPEGNLIYQMDFRDDPTKNNEVNGFT